MSSMDSFLVGTTGYPHTNGLQFNLHLLHIPVVLDETESKVAPFGSRLLGAWQLCEQNRNLLSFNCRFS